MTVPLPVRELIVRLNPQLRPMTRKQMLTPQQLEVCWLMADRWFDDKNDEQWKAVQAALDSEKDATPPVRSEVRSVLTMVKRFKMGAKFQAAVISSLTEEKNQEMAMPKDGAEIQGPVKRVLRKCRQQLQDGRICGTMIAVDPREVEWCKKCLHRQSMSTPNKTCDCGGQVVRNDGSLRCELCILLGRHVNDARPDSAVQCPNEGCSFWTYDPDVPCYRCQSWEKLFNISKTGIRGKDCARCDQLECTWRDVVENSLYACIECSINLYEDEMDS